MDSFLTDFLWVYTHPWVIVWVGIVLAIVILLSLLYKFCRNSSFMVLFDLMFEKIFEFFEDSLWKDEKRWVKVYITTLFFVILLANLFWVVLEFLAPVIWFNEEWQFAMEHYASTPSSDKNFNIAMAIIWVIIILFEQFRFLWVPKALYEYFPIFWKGYIPYKFWNLPKIADVPIFLLVKVFDIIISVFLWLLEIVWHLAKIISLAFRLFWNVTSGWLLLAMLVGWLATLTNSLLWFEFPIVWPVLIYLQETLVSLIQALVFPLLIAIFIKVAKVH